MKVYFDFFLFSPSSVTVCVQRGISRNSTLDLRLFFVHVLAADERESEQYVNSSRNVH